MNELISGVVCMPTAPQVQLFASIIHRRNMASS